MLPPPPPHKKTQSRRKLYRKTELRTFEKQLLNLYIHESPRTNSKLRTQMNTKNSTSPREDVLRLHPSHLISKEKDFVTFSFVKQRFLSVS